MYLNFEKWHGAKNDFVVTWITKNDATLVLDSLRRQAKKLCARDGSSIGADGILVLETSLKSDLNPKSLTIINSDGSLAENCGNGLRCAALSILRRHRLDGNPNEIPDGVELLVGSNAIPKSCLFAAGASKARWPHVTVEMGTPTVNKKVPWYESAATEIARVAQITGIKDLTRDFGVCEIGNPHLVFFLPQASRELLLKVGPEFQKSEAWDGINVHLVHSEEVESRDVANAKNLIGHQISEKFRAFVWERGAGETQACGSGACAIAACAMDSGTTSREDWVQIEMPGGALFVQQEESDAPIKLTGPGEFVFEGRLEI